jgi:hypothetical protein
MTVTHSTFASAKSDNPSKADLALVVERFSDFYRAATCLTLDMAYNNARQDHTEIGSSNYCVNKMTVHCSHDQLDSANL